MTVIIIEGEIGTTEIHMHHSNFQKFLVLSFVFICSLLLLFSPHPTLAQGPSKSNSPGPVSAPKSTQTPSQPVGNNATGVSPKPVATDGDKIDVSDLENKYWATKDTDFNVVQNRLYSKTRRFGISGFYGMMVNDPWSEGGMYGGSLSYFFSDRYGVQVTYNMIDSKDNKAVKQLAGIQGAYPNNNKPKGYYGASFLWVPFYAKMSLLGSSIIYFDMSFALGGGMQEYQQQRDDANVTKSAPAVSFEISQHFYLNKNFALRVDLENRWYSSETAWYRASSAATAGTRTVGSNTDNTTLLKLGLTFLY